MTTYVGNAFSLNMVSEFPAKIIVDKLDKLEFCSKLEDAQELGDLVSVIGHKSTAELVNAVCAESGVRVEPMRTQIKLTDRDTLLVVQVAERLPEGKVLTTEEVLKMYNEGKIEFYEVEVR